MGKYLELRFEFRTSEMQGVILSVAEPVGFPAISIELHKGKVMLSTTWSTDIRNNVYQIALYFSLSESVLLIEFYSTDCDVM